MATYKTSKQLTGKTLKEGDNIQFRIGQKTLDYEVKSNHLNHPNGPNDEIFTLLGLDKKEFAKKHYGYAANYGNFPECKDEDYKALTRITLALFKEAEKMPKSFVDETSLFVELF